MSKTAEEIGLIVGGVALAFIPGLQMVGAIAIQGHAALLAAMLGIGLSTALAGVGIALRPTPQTVGTANSIGFSGGVSPRRVIYGQFQTSGVLTYASFPPSQNLNTTSQYLHLIYTICSHEISSFDAVIVNGFVYNFGTDILADSSLPSTPWQIHPSVLAWDFYWEHMMFEFDFGRSSNFGQPFPNLANADSAWTSACLQQGCAKVHVILRADSGITQLYPSGQIPNIQFLVTGKKLVDPRITLAWKPASVYLQYSYIVDNRGVIWVQQTFGSGTSGGSGARPNFEGVSSFPATLSDNTCSWQSLLGWTLNAAETATLGNLYGAILQNDCWQKTTAFQQGVIIESPIGYMQEQTTATGPFSGSTPPTWNTSLGGTTTDGGLTWRCLGRSTHAINPSNPALVVYDYLQDSDAGMGTAASTIDTSSVIAAANVCEEQVLIIWNPDNATVNENLYSCSGMFDHSSTRGNVLSALLASMAGWAIPPGDQWHIFAGVYATPSLGFTDNDLRGPLKGDFRLSKRDVANSIKGTYTPAYLPASPAAALSMTSVPGTWQSQSFPPYQANGMAGKPNYLNSEDSGQVIWQDVHFEFTTSVWMAQRLAKITLMRLRFQETLTLQFKLTAFQLEAGDTFYFTHARWGIVSGVYEVTQVSLVIDTSGKDPVLGVDVIARQVDPSIYSFTAPSSSTNYGEYSPYGVTGQMTGVE